MTGKKESGKTILGQPGGFVEQDGSFYDFVSFRHSSMVFRVNTQLRCVEDGGPDLSSRSQEQSQGMADRPTSFNVVNSAGFCKNGRCKYLIMAVVEEL